MYPPIIEIADLFTLYKDNNVLIFDASNNPNALTNYNAKHLDGALFVDTNTQLAKIEQDLAIGGRHPLPNINLFAEIVGVLGITPTTHVVIYDDKNGANAAARFWWMLKNLGHQKVQILNGGIQEAEKNNFPINDRIATPNKTIPYPVTDSKLPTVTINEVEKIVGNKQYAIVDVREPSRYNGENEPIDLIAGHIPSAINIPFTENLDANGLFLTADKIKEKYQLLLKDIKPQNTIIHCGSGVTACHTILAMAYAKLELPKLYVGSWSEWSRNNKEIVTQK